MKKKLQILTERHPRRWIIDLRDALRSRGVDVALCAPGDGTEAIQLDTRPPAQDVRTGASRWRLAIGGERGGIPAFDEAARGEDSVDVFLLEEHVAGTLLLRSGCFPYASRYRRTIERIVEQCAAWIAEELTNPTSASHVAPWHGAPIADAPGLVDMLRFWCRETLRLIEHTLRMAFEEVRWDVAVTKGSVDAFVRNPGASWLHWLARDDREFLADPFVVSDASGAPHLLCETLAGSTPSIVSINLDDRFGARRPILGGDGRPASYPYAFEVDGELWMTPEQHRNGRLDAYRIADMTAQSVESILCDVAAVDPTIVEHDGLWWLFCTHQDDAPNYALRIYWSEHPSGPWHAHGRNPAKVDVTGARPAGNFFVRDGMLHRPAQDCTGRYGRALTIQRIDVLTPEEFRETCVARIDVSMLRRRGAIGVHTLSHGEGWVAIDAQFSRWSLRKPLRRLLAA